MPRYLIILGAQVEALTSDTTMTPNQVLSSWVHAHPTPWAGGQSTTQRVMAVPADQAVSYDVTATAEVTTFQPVLVPAAQAAQGFPAYTP